MLKGVFYKCIQSVIKKKRKKWGSDMEIGAKGNKKTELDVYVSCIVGGIAIAKWGSDVSMLGYGITALGSITTALELIKTYNPYKKLFNNLNMKSIPRYIGKTKTNYGYSLTFSLPFGMSTGDFEKNKLAIEQYLNKKEVKGTDY